MAWLHRFAASALLLLLALPAAADEVPPADRRYTEGPASRDGTGRIYMGREIARLMGHQGADWLERPGREREDQPDRLVAALDLAPDAVVADIGAGTGYYAFRIAPLVPDGRVLATDVQPEMLARITLRKRMEGVAQIETILGTVTDPKLPRDGVDVALLVDSYHEFSHPREMMDGIVSGLRSGGRFVLVEYRAEDPEVRIKPLHKMSEAQARREIEAAGLRFVRGLDVLPRQHMLVFEKP